MAFPNEQPTEFEFELGSLFLRRSAIGPPEVQKFTVSYFNMQTTSGIVKSI